MDIIRTGIGITKTFRNAGRLREIVSVFAKHGFDEVFTRALGPVIPNIVIPKSARSLSEDENQNIWKVVGTRLRLSFEELGAPFIKLGQLLSTREDIFAEEFIDEMKLLRDQVKSIPFSKLKAEVERSLGQKIEDVFESVDETAIGTASIGIVFKAKLKSGEDVVLKVRRPEIHKQINTDFSIIYFLVKRVESVSDEIKYLGISRIIQDFAASINNELNFNIEALNAERVKTNIEAVDTEKLFYFPKLYKEFSSERLIVLEYINGIPFSNDKINEFIPELQPKLESGLKLFIKTFLQDGFFHADLHGGNFFYQQNKQIALIDFGLCGSLGKKGRKNFIAIIYSIFNFDYENLVYEFLDVAEYDTIPDVDILIQDVKHTLAPFVGLTVQQTNFSQLFQQVIGTLNKHKIYLPREWFIVFRALMTLDGVGKSLDLDLDLFALLEDDIKDIMQESFSKDDILEELLWFTKDFATSARSLPRHMKWFLKDAAKKGYGLDLRHTGHEAAANKLSKAIIFMGLIIACAIFAMAGVLLLENKFFSKFNEVPVVAWIMWMLSLMGAFRAYLLIRKI